jgi:hypothetical protein
MNDRIKELAEEAGIDSRTMGFEANQHHRDPWNARLDRFVLLVVEDLLKLLQQEWYDLNNLAPVEGESPRDIGLRVGRKSEILALMGKIKKQYGIEDVATQLRSRSTYFGNNP